MNPQARTSYVPGTRFCAATVSVVLPPSLEPTWLPPPSSTVRISSAVSSVGVNGVHVIENEKLAVSELYVPAGTVSWIAWWSTVGSPETVAQLLVGCDAGRIVPVQLTVAVWPVLDGTVINCDDGVDAPPDPTANARAAVRPIAKRWRWYRPMPPR